MSDPTEPAGPVMSASTAYVPPSQTYEPPVHSQAYPCSYFCPTCGRGWGPDPSRYYPPPQYPNPWWQWPWWVKSSGLASFTVGVQ